MFGSGNGLATDWWQAIIVPEPMMTRFLSLYGVTRPQWVNSSWPSDAKWQHRSESTLAQVMAHFLMAPSHYLNHCSLIISEVLWPSTEGNRVLQEILKISILDMNLKIDDLRLQPHLPCANDLGVLLTCRSREAVQSWCLETPCCEHTMTISTISIIYHGV